jgi:hypothetical protein
MFILLLHKNKVIIKFVTQCVSDISYNLPVQQRKNNVEEIDYVDQKIPLQCCQHNF